MPHGQLFSTSPCEWYSRNTTAGSSSRKRALTAWQKLVASNQAWLDPSSSPNSCPTSITLSPPSISESAAVWQHLKCIEDCLGHSLHTLHAGWCAIVHTGDLIFKFHCYKYCCDCKSTQLQHVLSKTILLIGMYINHASWPESSRHGARFFVYTTIYSFSYTDTE